MKMRLSLIVLAAALTIAVPARAQQFNPAQAAAIAQGVVGLMFGVMFPQPQCGPHDNFGQAYRFQPRPPAYVQPQPYQPATPYYGQPQPRPQPNLSYEDDDDDGQPLQPLPPRISRRSSNDSRQPQPYSNVNEDQPDQPAQARATDPGQSYRPAPGDEVDDQPVEAVTRHRSAHHHRSQQTAAQDDPQSSVRPDVSGQVAEIPAQPHTTRPYRPVRAGQSAASSASDDSTPDQ
ncbi:MAG TPA: hypothetical protein VFE56_06995 [Candidatus Binataceae bacterium]|jgi:hypothetical protein|nr:hypothetical protein [Candidatus Binataceae bacterium]